MDGAADDKYRALASYSRLELIVADDRGIRSLGSVQVPVGTLARQVWEMLPDAARAAIEAVRIVNETGERLDQCTVYDRAKEFFGVSALTLGQMPAFRIGLALGLVARLASY